MGIHPRRVHVVADKGFFNLATTIIMHRALKVYDIISLICEQLEYLDTKQDKNATVRFSHNYRPSLSALAKTCKGFYEPVMQILCKCIHDIYPIFHVFTINMPGTADSPSPVELSPRFTTFTRRVRHVTLYFNISPPKYAVTQVSHFETLKLLNHKMGSMYLLPQLQSLRLIGWINSKALPVEEILLSLSSLLAPSLLRLAVSGFDQTLTHRILGLCALRNIRLKRCNAELSLEWVETSGLLEVITGCEFISPALTLQKGLLHRLAAFPNLQEFQAVSDTFTGPLPRGAFSKLCRFHYLAPEPSSFLHFLQQIPDASSLSGIQFTSLKSVARLEDGRAVAEALFQSPQLRPEIMTSFSVALSAAPELHTMSYIPSDAPWLSLFAQCINMKSVRIGFGRPLVITDAEFEQLVCHWYHLETIEILSCRGNLREPIQPLFSFGKINALVKHCPFFRTLSGFIDTTELTDDTLGRITSHNNHIDNLHFVSCSTVSNIELFAQHLYAWFPNLISEVAAVGGLCPCQRGLRAIEEIEELTIIFVWSLVNSKLQKLQDISNSEVSGSELEELEGLSDDNDDEWDDEYSPELF